MRSIKKEAIDSVNETVQTIRSAEKKNEDQEHFVSLVTFNDNIKTVYDCVPAREVDELTEETYRHIPSEIDLMTEEEWDNYDLSQENADVIIDIGM